MSILRRQRLGADQHSAKLLRNGLADLNDFLTADHKPVSRAGPGVLRVAYAPTRPERQQLRQI
jgi:hypothetical protein